MRLYRSVQGAVNGPRYLPSAVTLGNFDGIHRGHRSLIDKTIACAQANHWRSVMLTFDPMPSEFFASDRCPARLMSFIEKWTCLEPLGLDALYNLRFSDIVMRMSAYDFIETILVKALHAKHIFVGDDFRFGFRRCGDVALLQKYSDVFGYQVTTHTEFYENAKAGISRRPISSTWIRDAMVAGDFSLVETLLGYPYKNIGRVTYGSQLGRELGCPTANIPMNRRKSPVHGVYVVRIQGEDIDHYGVASVGNRPAIGNNLAFLLEVHLFDFSGDLYGKRLAVTYLHKLRDEWMFDSLAALKIQIDKDCLAGRAYLSTLLL